eukprot:12770796-Prorocentrum_lima.AAC.1
MIRTFWLKVKEVVVIMLCVGTWCMRYKMGENVQVQGQDKGGYLLQGGWGDHLDGNHHTCLL